MASGPSSQCSRAPAGAPPAPNDAHLSPQPSLNSESVAMPATELVTHNKRHHRTSESDFADAAPVFTAREQRAVNRALTRAAEEATARSQQQPVVGAAKPRALQQPRAAKANKARTTKKRPAPYRSLRMSASYVFPPSDDESVGNNTSNEGEVPVGAPPPPVSPKDEGEIGNDVPRHESLRMNASMGFGGHSARQAKQPRRRS